MTALDQFPAIEYNLKKQIGFTVTFSNKRHENHLRIHPEDADRAGINKNQMVEVRTKTGAVKIKPLFDDTIRKGVVSMSHGWGRQIMHPEKNGMERQGANANELTDDLELDPVVGIATYNAIPCSIHALKISSDV